MSLSLVIYPMSLYLVIYSMSLSLVIYPMYLYLVIYSMSISLVIYSMSLYLIIYSMSLSLVIYPMPLYFQSFILWPNIWSCIPIPLYLVIFSILLPLYFIIYVYSSVYLLHYSIFTHASDLIVFGNPSVRTFQSFILSLFWSLSL